MEFLTAPITHCRAEHVDGAGSVAVQIIEHRAAREVALHLSLSILTDGLEERVAGGYPFRRTLLGEDLFVEGHEAVVTPQPSIARLQPFPCGPQGTRHAPDSVHVGA